MQKTIKDFSIIELKSIAYDELIKLEQAKSNIKIINQELASRAENTQTKPNMDETNITPAVEEATVSGEEVTTTEEEVVAEVAGTEEVA